MRKAFARISLMACLLMIGGSLYAADLKDGFFDIQWKADLSQMEGFKKVGEYLHVNYFVNPGRIYSINEIGISDAVYGSYENQFFAVYIDIETIEVFARFRRHMNNNYGVPEITKKLPGELTTYQWKHKKTKIKLKIHENENKMKLAFYYTPLSGRVNESQQEAFQENMKNPVFPLTESEMQKAIDLMDLQGLGPR